MLIFFLFSWGPIFYKVCIQPTLLRHHSRGSLLLSALKVSLAEGAIRSAYISPSLNPTFIGPQLDVYIHDYLVKRKLSASAGTFRDEAQVLTNRTAIDAPGGFLLEWWSVFWDIFIARFRSPVSNISGSYNEVQMMKILEQQQQQATVQPQQLNQMQMQRQGDDTQLLRGATSEVITRQSPATSNALNKRMYQNNPPAQRNAPYEANKKKPTNPRSSDKIGQHLDANNAFTSKPETFRDQHSRQMQHGVSGGNFRFCPPLKDQAPQQLPVSELDQSLICMMNPSLNFKAAQSGGSLTEVSGSDHGVSSLLLKGWPLMGLEQLHSGLPQQQSSTIHLSHPSQLSLQQQIQMLLSNQYMDMSQGDQSKYTGEIVVDGTAGVQVGLPLFSRADSAMLMKLSQEQGQQRSLLGQQLENQNFSIQQEDKRVATGSNSMEVILSNTSRDDDQNRTTKKRRQLMASGQSNSLGTSNNTSLLPSSAPSTPSVSSAGDAVSIPALLHDDNSIKASGYGNDVVCSATLVSSQTVDVPLRNHGSVDNSVESFLSDNADAESIISRCLGTSKDISFLEIGTLHSSSVNCCDLSSDAKLIANGGDKEVLLWCTDSREQKHILEEHTDAITDVRFGPRSPRLASSSLDMTIKIWDVHNPGYSIRSFTGHSASVMSLDFHPFKEDLICSCDNAGTIRYWSIKNGGCAGVSKVHATQVRFQPIRGKYLAAAVVNGVSLIDVETTQTSSYPLKGHISKIQSICWSSCGEYLASLSEDMVRVWKIGSNGEQQCMHEQNVTGKRFRCCTFHPCYPSVLILGSYQCLELWHMAENKLMILQEESVSSLAAARSTGLVVSASDNNLIRLWK